MTASASLCIYESFLNISKGFTSALTESSFANVLGTSWPMTLHQLKVNRVSFIMHLLDLGVLNSCSLSILILDLEVKPRKICEYSDEVCLPLVSNNLFLSS